MSWGGGGGGDDNPFAGAGDNPFSAAGGGRPEVGSKDNPFTDRGQAFVIAEEDEAPQQAPSARGSAFPIPASSLRSAASAGPSASTDDKSPGGGSTFGSVPATQRELDLERREQELERREKELQKLIKDTGYKPKNWPSCYPVLYHNINEEIPAESQRLVRTAYYSWMLTVVGWLWFWFSVLLGVIFDAEKLLSGFANFVVNSMACVIGLWVSWNVNYRTLYRAARLDSVISYGWFFLNYTIHIGWWIWTAIGLTAINYPPGFLTMLEALDVNTFVGVIYAIAFSLDVCVAAFSCWVQLYAIRKFRNKGGVEELARQAGQARTVANVAHAAGVGSRGTFGGGPNGSRFASDVP